MGIKPSVHFARKNGSATSHASQRKTSTETDGERYVLHEEWLADVCGVSRRRLTIRDNDEMLLSTRPPPIGVCLREEEEPPTQEEILKWAKSFDNLMQSRGGQRLFRDYLQSEFSAENLLFWLACEDLKEEKDESMVKEKAKLIYEDYISILSPKEVSLDGQAREAINRNMLDPTIHAFDEAQLQIYMLMQRDSYPRFLNSAIYTQLLEQ